MQAQPGPPSFQPPHQQQWGRDGQLGGAGGDARRPRQQPIAAAKFKDYVVYVRRHHMPSQTMLDLVRPFTDRCWLQDVDAIPEENRPPWMRSPPVVVSVRDSTAFIGNDAFAEMERFYKEELLPNGSIQFTPSTKHNMTTVSLDDDSFADASAEAPGSSICGKPFATVDPSIQGLGARILGDHEKVNSATIADYIRLRNATAPRPDLAMQPPPAAEAMADAISHPQAQHGGRRGGESVNDFQASLATLRQQQQHQQSLIPGQQHGYGLGVTQAAATQGWGTDRYQGTVPPRQSAPVDTTGFEYRRT